jgi:hypothetical protein
MKMENDLLFWGSQQRELWENIVKQREGGERTG